MHIGSIDCEYGDWEIEMLTTSLKAIREEGPCEIFDDLLDYLGKTRTQAKHDETPFSLAVVLESNGLDDTLWVLDNVIKDQRITRLLAADYADRVLHIFEAKYPDDDRPRKAIAAARDLSIDAAARDSDMYAAWDAFLADARESALATYRDSDMYAARDAAGAALAAAWDSALHAAWCASSAARDHDRDSAQAARLRQYIEHGEAAAKMPWAEV